jgi:probable phosphomutase (TIGR03848 family)
VTTLVYLVRHGVTNHTGHRLSGWMEDIHLSEKGREQAEAVADLLTGTRLKAVYSSPIDRTVETARPIAARHDLGVRTRRHLGEVDYGTWTNRSFRSLTRTRLWTTVQRYPSGARFPQGETLREVQARAVTEVEKLAANHPRQTICCVSHADVIRLVCAHFMGIHIDLFQRLVIGPASVSVVALQDDGPRILSLNTSAPMPQKESPRRT